MKTKFATFAGGCFWCMIQPFQAIKGVKEVIPGYIGGKTKNPTYEQVTSGRTGHLEAVQVEYDPSIAKYETLLETFWHQIDPEDPNGQFADQGTQYKTAIFYHDEEQKTKAQKSKEKLAASGKFKIIATEVKKAGEFFPAEQYHWNYPKKHPLQYKLYKKMSGREGYLKKTWGES